MQEYFLMRKWVSAIVTGVLILIPLQYSNAASPKSGAICIKINSKQTYNGKVFTCVKSGKKLVWDKGVVLAPSPKPTKSTTPVPSESPSPIKSPTPSPTPTPTATPLLKSDKPGFGPAHRYQYQYVDGVLQRKNEFGNWQSDDSRATTSFDPIRVAAYKAIRSKHSTSADAKIVVTEHITEAYPAELSAAIKLEINDFVNYLSPYLNQTLNMNLILVTEKDKNYVKTDLPKILDVNYYGDLPILNEYTDKESFYRRSGTGGGMAGFDKSTNLGFYLGHTSSLAQMETYWPEIAPHEMSHAVQFFLARGYQNSCDEGTECGKWHGHLTEGSANVVGMAIAFPNLGWYSDEMNKILKSDIERYGAVVQMKNESDAVDLFKRIESRTTELSDSFSYSAGQVLWEYYIATYGFQKWIDLYSNLPKTDNFNENLKATIGIDKQTFYRKAAPYFLSVWTRLAN